MHAVRTISDMTVAINVKLVFAMTIVVVDEFVAKAPLVNAFLMASRIIKNGETKIFDPAHCHREGVTRWISNRFTAKSARHSNVNECQTNSPSVR